MIRHLLYRLTLRLPARAIKGDDGAPYLERYRLGGGRSWGAFIHRFLDSDPDRGLHDHPWRWAVSLVLVGGYREHRGFGPKDPEWIRSGFDYEIRQIRPWRINFIRGTDFHRILLRENTEAWTLFIHGPRIKGWGFLRGGALPPLRHQRRKPPLRQLVETRAHRARPEIPGGDDVTPLQIEIILHYATRSGDYRGRDFGALAVRATIDSFLNELDLLVTNQEPHCSETGDDDDETKGSHQTRHALRRRLLRRPLFPWQGLPRAHRLAAHRGRD